MAYGSAGLSMTDPKVLFIAGWGRSGSTVLDRVLGELDGWHSCGELQQIWVGFTCACGASISECPFWGPLLDEVLPRHGLDYARAGGLRRTVLGSSVWTLGPIVRVHRRGSDGEAARRYAALAADLYRTVARATGARVLVDSSKRGLDAYLLARLAELDLYVVHLVRDPRANAYSRRRQVRGVATDHYLPTTGPVRASLGWLRRNALIDVLVRPGQGNRFSRLRYEDFCADPRGSVEDLCRLVGEERSPLPFTGERTVPLPPGHLPAGNPLRAGSGELTVALDDEWTTRMGRRARLTAAAVALPLMRRYGYLGSDRP